MRLKSKAILAAGFITGTLDALAASMSYYINTGGKGPAGVFKFVASGAFGPQALSGSSLMVGYGLFFHYLFAFGFTVIFFILYPVASKIIRSGLVVGGMYGIVVWLIMNFIVMPLSRVPQTNPSAQQRLIGCIIIFFCIGLPLALFAQYFYRNKQV